MDKLIRKLSCLLMPLLLVLLPLSIGLIFFYAPQEATQGMVQKIFYFHVSCAMAMNAGFVLAGLLSLLFLWKRSVILDQMSHAAVSVGLLFCTLVLVSGPIWAKPIWGTWWTWEPRLTTTILLWLIFMATLFLRQFHENSPKGRVFASVMTLFGVLDVPLIFLSVRLWRGIHPQVMGQKDSMPSEMILTLIVSNLAMLVLFGVIWILKTRILILEEGDMQ